MFVGGGFLVCEVVDRRGESGVPTAQGEQYCRSTRFTKAPMNERVLLLC